ncbi:MAG: 4Fe-4S dicluster domain-containing protein [Candidatus Margulisiibacteriota bacterium]
MQTKFIEKERFTRFIIEILKEYRGYAPFKFDERNILQEVTAENANKLDLSGYRTTETFKPILFQVMEMVSRYFNAAEKEKKVKVALIGLRGCDLEGINIEDRVFGEGERTDPFYVKRRESVLLIGADCTNYGKTCFCDMVGGKLYCTNGFDLNISIVKDGYLVSSGTALGDTVLAGNSSLFSDIKEGQSSEVENNRELVERDLIESNKKYATKMSLNSIHKINLENKIWKELTKDCVECSSCNLTCPSCTCFLLFDQKAGKSFERYKVWDACLKNGYAKLAGGGNSRHKMSDRLQNRYHCKFDYSFDRLGRYSCVGCGRCIDGCAGNIDMRKIFVELEKQVPLTVKLE